MESERKYRDLYEHSTDGIIIADLDSNILDANPTALEILGYELDELTSMSGADLNSPADREAVISVGRRLPFGETLRFRRNYRKKNGEYIPVESHIRRLDHERYQVLFSDITERLRMEEELKRSHDELEKRVLDRTRELEEANLRLKAEIEERKTYERSLKQSENELLALLNATTQPIALLDAGGKVLKTNQVMRELLLDDGGEDSFRLMDPEAAMEQERMLESVRASGSPIRFCTWGGSRTMEFSIFPVLSDEGIVSRMALYAQDLTEEKQTMAQLAENRERYQLVTENQLDVIWTLDRDLNVSYVSPSIQRLTGYTTEEFMKLPWTERFTPEGVDLIRDAVGPVMNAKTVASFIEDNPRLEIRTRRKDGSGIWTEITHGVQRDSSGNVNGVYGATRDISERKKTEEKLKVLASKVIEAQENERMRIGRELHDSTAQTLSAFKVMVEGEIKRLSRRLPDEDMHKLKRIVPALQDTIVDLRRIITNLRPTMLDDMGLAAALGWLCKEHEIYAKNIEIPFSIALGDYEGDPAVDTAVFRVAQEALANALKHSGAARIELGLKRTPEYLVLTVEDDGCGIDPEKLDSSEGIGLQSIRERIEPLSGKFAIHSEPGRGTHIKATLPVPHNPPENRNRSKEGR
jgi:PAS domain S-box-containing protein